MSDRVTPTGIFRRYVPPDKHRCEPPGFWYSRFVLRATLYDEWTCNECGRVFEWKWPPGDWVGEDWKAWYPKEGDRR